MIKGNNIELIPAALGDRERVYEWCFRSETTKSHAGPPDYPDILIPTLEEFCSDYVDYFFDGSRPHEGRGFLILHQSEPVGFISYSSFHLKPYKSELDIWLNSEAHCGKGLGTDALRALGDYLHEKMGVCQLIIRPSFKNRRAIKSYKKAGFVISEELPSNYMLEEFISIYGDGDYGDEETALLVKWFEEQQ